MMAETTRQGGATVLAITSGKGGVGKTSVAVNLALALARLGHRTGILDADFGLGNVDVMLGLTPERHLGHLLAGLAPLQDVLLRGPQGVQILPAGSGVQALTALTPAQRAHLDAALDALRRDLDFLLIDTAAGISDNVLAMLRLAGRVVLVTSLDPTSVVDAYATAKVLSVDSPDTEIGVVVNQVRDAEEATLAFRQLDTAAARFLGRSFRYYGSVMADPAVREAAVLQRAIVDHHPQAPASRCFRILASRIAGLGHAPGGIRLATPVQACTSAEVRQCA